MSMRASLRMRLFCLLLAVMTVFLSAMPATATEAAKDKQTTASSSNTVSDSATSDSDDGSGGAYVYPSETDALTEYEWHDTQQPMRDITAAQLLSEINLGWNLGEALDSWSSDAGYDDYHNSNAYQMIIRYDDAEGQRSTSIANTFKSDNTVSFTWQTGLIETDAQTLLGDIGFEVWNFTVEEPTEIVVRCNKAQLKRRTGAVVDIEALLGEHTMTITKYGTGAVLTDQFPEGLTKTYGITDGTLTIELELIDFPQKEYGKSEYFETLWNNPITTPEMITEVKRMGFNAVRVPVTYFNHTLSSTDAIDEGWLDRVQTVVDYVISQDMYCILDMHNDGAPDGWLRVNTSQSDVISTKYAFMWQQIAFRFRNYDERLLFQSFDELTDKDENWGYPGAEDTEWVNGLNQLFVDTIRATGGNNSTRHLVLMPYAGAYDSQILGDFRMPEDSIADRLIVSVNAYLPADFSWAIESEEDTSYTDVFDWGSAEDEREMDRFFTLLNNTFISRGVPVMITEFGTVDKDNLEARIKHAEYYISSAKKYNIPCFWWDAGDLFLRKSMTWSFPTLVDAMVDVTSVHLRRCEISLGSDTYYTGEAITPAVSIIFDQGRVVSGGDIVELGNRTLVEGTDYKVEYKNNIELGEGTVTITGLNDYSGIMEMTFPIEERPFGASVLGRLSGGDPDLPLALMLSIPLLLALAGVTVLQTFRRKERERTEAIIAESLKDVEQQGAFWDEGGGYSGNISVSEDDYEDYDFGSDNGADDGLDDDRSFASDGLDDDDF